jgi:hypothetical protein
MEGPKEIIRQGYFSPAPAAKNIPSTNQATTSGAPRLNSRSTFVFMVPPWGGTLHRPEPERSEWFVDWCMGKNKSTFSFII